ncbi:MAG: cobalamin-dependent protein [Sedimentisphaerales bacterium]|nr:cobalamin-dependent protein [Sedimentisphaerales bacterium]
MNLDKITARYLEKLFEGDRIGCRNILGEALQTGTPARVIYTDLFWTAMSVVENRYRNHEIDIVTEHMATRINRTLVDQLQSKLPRSDSRNMKMIIACSDDEPEELGAQMCADLFESDGWEVKFLGGGVPNDEILAVVANFKPDIIFLYGTKPSGAPDVRRLIDTVRAVGAAPNVRFMLSGGIFNRAEGLWDEIGADMFAPTAKEALEIALTDQHAQPDTRRHRRKSAKNTTPQEEPVSV